MMTTTQEYRALAAAEALDLTDLMEGLSREQLDSPSLCAGWRVRDVLGHLYTGATSSLPKILGKTAAAGFSIDKASFRGAIQAADDHAVPEMTGAVRKFAEEYADGGANKGIVRVTSARQLLVDQMVHQQDVRRPLGLAREIPAERLRAALDAAPGVAGPVRAKRRAAGLRLEATDVDWSTGSGPVVRGTGEALLMALTGRQVVLDELEGDGVAVLRQRCGA